MKITNTHVYFWGVGLTEHDPKILDDVNWEFKSSW